MRHFFILTLILTVLAACGQNKSSKVTVVLFDNQNPNFIVTIDTLFKAQEQNLADTPIDLFFSCKNFHMPYYVPTDGIYKNTAKEKECDMKFYPANVKCYEYDDKKRVIKMSINGSGTMNNFRYVYNDKDQVVEINEMGKKFVLEYNANGMLSELRQSDGVISKKLVFIYKL